MASIISSSSNTSLPPSWPSESNSTKTSLRDMSFSSYLNSSEEDYIRSLVRSSTQKLRTSHESQHDSRKKKPDDGEIDVFGAEKYFNGGIDEESSKSLNHDSRNHDLHHHHQHTNHDSKDHHTPALKLRVQQPRTPSSHSESSWNSQSALLKKVQRIPSRSSRTGNNHNNNNKNNNTTNGIISRAQGNKRSLFLPCYCCDNSAVDINEQTEIMQTDKIAALRSDPNFVFPVLENPRIKPDHHEEEDDDDDEIVQGRKSLEVFGSNEVDIDGAGSKSFSLERRLSMLSWDAIPRPPEEEEEEELINHRISAGPPTESFRDETGSDASSDLFEIECLSCSANPVVVVGSGHPRPASPDGGCSTPTTFYAPSEASIEWSVVTASAADFSVVSDSEDQRSTVIAASTRPTKRAHPPANKPRTGPGMMLLGCKSQKAVRVAGEALPLKRVNKNDQKQRMQEMKMKKYSENKNLSLTPTISKSRFQAEAKVFQKQNQDGVVIPSPRWSHSSHASEVLYIQ